MDINKTLPKTILIFLVSVVILVVSGCDFNIPDSPGSSSAQVLESKLPRAEVSDISGSDLIKLAEGNTAFTLDLYQQIKSTPGNLFYSPYSISSALAMTYAGSEGKTAEEMAAAMHFLLPQESLHSAFNGLDHMLTSLAEIEIPEGEGDPFQLNIANSLWGQEGFHFESDFLDILAENYGAGLRLLDYISQPEESRQTINQWVSDETKEKIQNLIPQGAITSDTRLVLSNAIYFKATWLESFEEALTEEGTFFGLDGEEIPVPMMGHSSSPSFLYFKGEGFQAVELPYIGNQVSMLVLVPDRGSFADFEAQLCAETLSRVLDGLTYSPIDLKFPKFEFESGLSLARTLSDMGMPTAFSDGADFSGMTGSKDLFISDVFHKAFVSVDEEGTEAAAATAVLMQVTSMPESPLELTVDRPFLFLIREHETNTILFIGRVVSP